MHPLLQLAAAWVGSLGFAMLFNVRGKKLPLASLGGLLAWAVYLLIARHTSNDSLCGFCASVALTLYAEVMAILEKSPVTVFLVSAAIPLIPGAALYRAMDGLMHGRTVFVIAHRLSTVRNAKAIMVLEQGQIIERGDHEDLIEQHGRYYQLYTGQLELD